MELDFSFLPDLPQIKMLKRIATNIWRNEEVRAIWVEGSFGQGTADLYSDVDLRLAVPAARLKEWETPDLTALFEGVTNIARFFTADWTLCLSWDCRTNVRY